MYVLRTKRIIRIRVCKTHCRRVAAERLTPSSVNRDKVVLSKWSVQYQEALEERFAQVQRDCSLSPYIDGQDDFHVLARKHKTLRGAQRPSEGG